MSMGMTLFLLIAPLFILRAFVWARRVWRNMATPLWGNGLQITDMEPVKERTAPPVRVRWWHEPAAWAGAFALVCFWAAVGDARTFIGFWQGNPPYPYRGDEPFPSDTVFFFVLMLLLGLSFLRDMRSYCYEINDDGIRRKRWFRGEYLIPWEDVQSVGISDYWPMNLLITFKKPNGGEGHILLVNGFYTRKAFEPAVYRLLGRTTVLEEEAHEPAQAATRPDESFPPSVSP